jgi:endonuclease/exonuclease/phosphatase (EEP) superfamily protein YafD
MYKIAINLLAVVPLGLLLLGALPDLHPVADSLAVFRVPIGGICVLVGAVFLPLWPRKYALMMMALGAGAALPILLYAFPDTPDKTARYTLYQKNLFFRNQTIGMVTQDIQTRKPDFITLQEVTIPHQALLKSLAKDYPTQLLCPFGSLGGVAIAARWPVIAGSETCFDAQGMAAVQLRTPDGPVWVVSVHLHWPYPFEQARQVAAFLPELGRLNGLKIVAGDFNMVPWSGTITNIEQAGNLNRIGYINSTLWLKRVFPLPIDHVLISAPNTGTVENLPLLGSDHNGVFARFSLDKQNDPTRP